MSPAGPQTLHAPLKPITHLPSDPSGKLLFSLRHQAARAPLQRELDTFFSQQSAKLFAPLAQHLLQALSWPVFSQQTVSHWTDQLPSFNPSTWRHWIQRGSGKCEVTVNSNNQVPWGDLFSLCISFFISRKPLVVPTCPQFPSFLQPSLSIFHLSPSWVLTKKT